MRPAPGDRNSPKPVVRVPPFRGAHDLVDLVVSCYVRPLRARRPGLPMICLIRSEHEYADLVPVLDRMLAGSSAERRTPHTYLRLPEQIGGTDPTDGSSAGGEVLDSLRELADGLAQGRNSRAGWFRFPRLQFVAWLMKQDLSTDAEGRPEDDPPDRVLRRRLRWRAWRRRAPTVGADIHQHLNGSWVLAVAVLFRVPAMLRWLRSTGRVPGLGGESRWLLRQRYLTPRDPGSFLGFAERLTQSSRAGEDPDEIDHLLVNCFLADLCRGYRGVPWRSRGTRTTYPVVLLDGVSTGNGGFHLLSLINEVRTDTGHFDPLLVVAAGADTPPEVANGGRAPLHCVHVRRGYQDWRRRLRAARRSPEGKPTAWYLPVRIPPPAPDEPPDPHAGQLDPTLPVTAPRSVLRTVLWSRAVPVTALAAVLVAGAGLYVPWRSRHCGQLLPVHSTLVDVDGECVGISAGDYHFQGSDKLLDYVQDVQASQNREAEEEHRHNPRRPYVTIAYLAALTVPGHTGTDPVSVAEREELEGVLRLQRSQIDQDSTTMPLFRVLVANAGHNMTYGSMVANLLADAAGSGPTFIGVVGLDQSRQNTVDAIGTLGSHGIPMVAATLSADSLPTISKMYYQVAPQNIREATVAAHYYADKELLPNKKINEKTIRIYYSADPGDIYSQNLRNDLEISFRVQKFTVQPSVKFIPDNLSLPMPSFSPPPLSAEAAGRRACDDHGLVYYAGRAEDFTDFLRGLTLSCGSWPPAVLGDDDLEGYVANPAQLKNSPISFSYESFAFGPKTCHPRPDDFGPVVTQFYQSLFVLFPHECQNGLNLARDGDAALAYDAVTVLQRAIDQLNDKDPPIPLSAAAVWGEIARIKGNGSSLDGLNGLTGTIDFGGTTTPQVPKNKPITIVDISNDGIPQPGGFCGVLPGAHRSEYDWCPHDR